MNPSSFWREKCVIITGASSGIGWALAEALAARGAKLGLIARRADKLEELALRIQSRGGAAAFSVADVADASQTRDAVNALEQVLGPCDVMVANAGIHRYSPGFRLNTENACGVISTNLLGVVNALGAAVPGMIIRRRGHVVAIASIAALLGLPEVGVYCASKAAVVTFMQSLRLDLHRFGVKVTTVCPGFVDTPMLRDHDSSLLKFVLPVREAVRRIAAAIERGQGECWFPRSTWLLARLGRAVPFPVYRWFVQRLPRLTRAKRSQPRGPEPDKSLLANQERFDGEELEVRERT